MTGKRAGPWAGENTRTEEVEPGAAIHLPLYGFQSVHLPFNLTAAPLRLDGCSNCRKVLFQSVSESNQRAELAVLHLFDPFPQSGGVLAFQRFAKSQREVPDPNDIRTYAG